MKKEYASVNLGGFGAPYAAPEPTTMGGVGDDQDQTSGLAFAPPAEPEPAAPVDAQAFQVTADGPVFDMGEPAGEPAEAAPGAPQFDLGGEAPPAAGPVFDLGDGAEPAGQAEAPTFDLGGSAEADAVPVKPDFDLEDAEPVQATPDAAVGAPPVVPAVAYQPGSMEDQVFQAISSVLVDLANEIRRSLEYYTTRYNKAPERIFLCGGTAKIPHLDEFLTQELGVTVQVANPLANLNVKVASASDRYLNEISPMLAVSIGLAIRDMVG
jgi:hypothetical protein